MASIAEREDNEEVSAFQQFSPRRALWHGIATMGTIANAYEEFEPGEAPAWFWTMVDQGQELVRDGADGEQLGNMLLQAILDLDDRQLLADMELHYNGILRAINQEHARHGPNRNQLACSGTESRRYVNKVVGTIVHHWLHGSNERRKRPRPDPPNIETDTEDYDTEDYDTAEDHDTDVTGLMEKWPKDRRHASPTRLWKELPDSHKTHTTRTLLPPWKKQNNPPLRPQPRQPPGPPPGEASSSRKASKRRCEASPVEEPKTPREEPASPEEMSLDDALAVWKALFEFEQLELATQSDGPVLPQGLLDNIVETLVDRPVVEHQVLIQALPTFLGKMQIDIASALERAKNLRRRLEGDDPGSSTDPPATRDTANKPDNEEHKPDHDEEYDDETMYMQTDIRHALDSPKKEVPLLDKLHRAFLQLRPSAASSRALRLMSLLQDHSPEDYLAVDRSALEALLVAINSETPPMPQADELLMEHSWCGIWWSRLRGQDRMEYDDAELELHHVEEVQAARERAIKEAEEADQDAREMALQRRLDEMAEQHMEQLKSTEVQQHDDQVMEAAKGLSRSRPKKRLCVGICITDGVQTKAWDWELQEDRPLQVHIRAEARNFPGQWYRAGRPIPDSEVPDILKTKDEKKVDKEGEKNVCRPAPRFAYDLQKPATQELHRRWRQGEISDQTLVAIAGVDMLAFFKANEEITEDELNNLSNRDTMDLQPAVVPEVSSPSVTNPDCAPTQLCELKEAEEEAEDGAEAAERGRSSSDAT